MDKQPKIDLKNGHIGGRPKDWLERGADYDAEFSWWDDLKMIAGLVGLPLLIAVCAGGFLYSLFKFASKF